MENTLLRLVRCDVEIRSLNFKKFDQLNNACVHMSLSVNRTIQKASMNEDETGFIIAKY